MKNIKKQIADRILVGERVSFTTYEDRKFTGTIVGYNFRYLTGAEILELTYLIGVDGGTNTYEVPLTAIL